MREGKRRPQTSPAAVAATAVVRQRPKRRPERAAASAFSPVENGGTDLTPVFLALLGATVTVLALAGARRGWPRGGAVAAPAQPLVQAPGSPAPPTAEPESAPPARQIFAAPAHPRRPALPAMTTGWETCEITWWRGYVRCDFYAATTREGEPDAVVARSPVFRWRSEAEPPPIDEIVAARDTLGERLVAAGWEEIGVGASWYAHRYRRYLDEARTDP